MSKYYDIYLGTGGAEMPEIPGGEGEEPEIPGGEE
jgi:hypothetical protein